MEMDTNSEDYWLWEWLNQQGWSGSDCSTDINCDDSTYLTNTTGLAQVDYDEDCTMGMECPGWADHDAGPYVPQAEGLAQVSSEFAAVDCSRDPFSPWCAPK